MLDLVCPAMGRASHQCTLMCVQYAAINAWILGNSNGTYQTTYNGTTGALGTNLTKQPTLFGTDLQCVPDLI